MVLRVFHLPSPGTSSLLNNLLVLLLESHNLFLKVLKSAKNQQASDNEYILKFDVLTLKTYVQYNAKEDVLKDIKVMKYKKDPQLLPLMP